MQTVRVWQESPLPASAFGQPEAPSPTRRRTAVRPVAVVPTYNHGGSLSDVVVRIRRLGLPTIVVDDGSTDDTAQVLERLAARGLHVRRHEVNRGKAAALRTGFETASRLGFTHAVTIDADGQLDPEQVPDLLAVAREHPEGLVVGVRDASAPDYPGRSALGRAVSNLFVRLETGFRVADSQCGFRVYPLSKVRQLDCRTGRYGYETEVLTRALWAGVKIREVPVRCRYFEGARRVSHLHPVRETLRAVAMHGRLLLTAPPRYDSATCAGSGHRLALSLAVGVFVACQPFYGFQTVAALALAWLLGLNAAAVVAGSFVSTPPVSFALIGVAVGLGHLLLHGSLPILGFIPTADVGWKEVATQSDGGSAFQTWWPTPYAILPRAAG